MKVFGVLTIGEEEYKELRDLALQAIAVRRYLDSKMGPSVEPITNRVERLYDFQQEGIEQHKALIEKRVALALFPQLTTDGPVHQLRETGAEMVQRVWQSARC